MTDPTSVNLLLAEPTNNSDVGTWDAPVNANMTALDGKLAGVVSIALSSSNVTLSKPTGTTSPGAGPSQAMNAVLRFTGTLTANVTITLPLPGYYIVENNCTVGAFYALISGGSGNKVGAPPGEACHVYSDGTDAKYVNMGRVGTYIDLAGSSVPAWMSNSTVQPYLACDGTAYSRTTYAALFALISTGYGVGDGSTTFNVPDLRNRARFYINNFGNGASNRITTAGSGVDGTTLGASGGTETVTLTTAQLPAHSHSVTDAGHSHTVKTQQVAGGTGSTVAYVNGVDGSSANVVNSTTTGITLANTGSGTAHNTMPPAQIAGITLIKT